MPDSRRHRGAHPDDLKLFAPDHHPALRAAVAEMSWLLTRGYPPAATLKLVGDRYRLTDRQRTAVSRASCSDGQQERRARTRLALGALRGEALAVDGFNLLITLEAALSGAVLLRCRDGCTRDIASIHGSYRSVEETDPALSLIGAELAELGPASVHWVLDSPVSNSGRLAVRLREKAAEHGWPWTVETVFDPDGLLVRDARVVVTSDSMILDGVARWSDVASHLIRAALSAPWLIDLAP